MKPMLKVLTAAVLSSGVVTAYSAFSFTTVKNSVPTAKPKLGFSIPAPGFSFLKLSANKLNYKTKIQHLSHAAPDLNQQVLARALSAYQKAATTGEVKNHKLTVIDYSLPSNKERMWVFDLESERLLFHTHVAHGIGSGADVPHVFSNNNSSHATSLGTYVTKDVYTGHNGYSLNLKGLEHGFNDRAYERRVVVHGAWYMSPSFIKQSGRAGRSWGCPAIAHAIAKPLINAIKNGSVIFAYYPDRNYQRHSTYGVA